MGTWARNHARPSTFIRKKQTWNYLIGISVERFSKSSGRRFTLTTRCWIPPTDDTGVLAMSAVVLSPSIMPTSCNGRLITSAFHGVQPDGVRTSSRTECCFSRRKFCPREVQHVTYDMCFRYSPIIVAYCPPLSVVFHFHSTLVGLCRASQTDFDSLYVKKETCCQIMIFLALSFLISTDFFECYITCVQCTIHSLFKQRSSTLKNWGYFDMYVHWHNTFCSSNFCDG